MLNASKVYAAIQGGRVRPFSEMTVDSMATVADLERIGICVTPSFVQDAFQAVRKMQMDSALTAPITTASIGTPIQFLQSWLPGFVHVLTKARKIDDIVGIATVGRWEDEEIVQGILEKAGFATPYGDKSNSPMGGWNTNFERRTVVRFESGIEVNRLEDARGSAMNLSVVDSKRKAASEALEIQRNYIGFYGYNSGTGRTYGLLNEPNLPAYVNLPNGDGGSSTFASKTTLEQIADILTSLAALRSQSGDRIDPKKDKITITFPTSVVDLLATPTTLGYSVLKWMADNYPNVRVESAPEFEAANGGANVFYVVADGVDDGMSTDGGQSIMQLVPAKFITLGVQQMTKGYEEAYANATAGLIVKRPFGVVRRSGC